MTNLPKFRNQSRQAKNYEENFLTLITRNRIFYSTTIPAKIESPRLQDYKKMSKEKYNLLKRKLKELLQENMFLTDKVEKQAQRIKVLSLEKDLLLERLAQDEEAAKEFILNQAQRAPSEGSVSDLEMSLDSELKLGKRKKPKKTLKIKKIQPVVTGEDGMPIYPIKLGLITVENLGVIVNDRDSFHNDRYIYPVGFRITREYWSTRDPESVVTFTCEIRDGGNGPSFIVTPSDYPQDQVISTSPTGAWAQIFKRNFLNMLILKVACELRNAEPPKATAGPEYFGFTQPTIAYLIEQLPNANLCKNYQKQLVISKFFKNDSLKCLIKKEVTLHVAKKRK